jgi:hypothetical protein
LRDHVVGEALRSCSTSGAHAPPLAEFTQPMLPPSGRIYFVVGDDVYAHRARWHSATA